MKNLMLLLFCCLGFSTFTFAQFNTDESKVLQELEGKSDEYFKIAKQIWDYAEVGYQEVKSSKLLQETLESEGFKMKVGVAETCWRHI